MKKNEQRLEYNKKEMNKIRKYNKKEKTPQTINVPNIPKDTKIPNLKNLLFKELYANTKKRSGIIKNGTNS